VKFLHIYKDKKPWQHYTKNYDFQVEFLGFQNLENSLIVIEKENMSAIGGVLLYNAIPSCELDEIYKEAKWLETNANESKRGPSVRG
jgi:lipopolysaccharide biosynthesis glycosyltransferase